MTATRQSHQIVHPDPDPDLLPASSWPKSVFGANLTAKSGILELMDDLGKAMASGGKYMMMGGGNPGHIPEIQGLWRERMAVLLDEDGGRGFDAMLADYDGPVGNPRFLTAVAGLLNREFGWSITEKNVAVTAGGQTAFFLVLNRLAGDFADGRHRRVMLPLMPEYIGYANQGTGVDLFASLRPRIELLGNHVFKYRVDFDNLKIDDSISAVCVSRPTNPSGNVLTDDEVRRLSDLTKEAGIPLVIDNAYGVPFPGVIFEDVQPLWDEHIIVTLSLSKLGLPGTRTGIVIAREDVIQDVAAMTAVVGLANGNVGQALTTPIIESGEILRLSRDVVRPFYAEKSALAQRLLREALPDELPWHVHKSEGAFFVWLWFEGMPITTKQLYERLKARYALIVPGEYFFYGQDTSDWRHSRECLRLSYTQPEETLRKGIAILGEEVTKAYRGE